MPHPKAFLLLFACLRFASASLPGTSENILGEILSQVKAQGEKLRAQDEKIANLEAELARSRSDTQGQEGGEAKRKLSAGSTEIEMTAGSGSNFIVSEENGLTLAVGGSSPNFFFDSSGRLALGRLAINNNDFSGHKLHVRGEALISNTASSSGMPTLTLTRTGSGEVFTAKTTGNDGLVFSVNVETNSMQLASIQGGKNLDLWANSLTLSSGGKASLELHGNSMSALNVFHSYYLGQFPTALKSQDKDKVGHLKFKLDNHYYGGFTFEVFMDYGRDWGGHGYATYYGRFMWVGLSTTYGKLYKITEFGASGLQGYNAISLNGWKFENKDEPADYLYLSFASNTVTGGSTDNGWQPHVTVVVHDTRNTVQDVSTSSKTASGWEEI